MSNKLGQKKRKEQILKSNPHHVNLTRDPNDSWAEVELYRWQHGELPPQDGNCKELNVPEALNKMAEAFEKNRNEPKNWPAPFNIVSVLKYAAKLIKENE